MQAPEKFEKSIIKNDQYQLIGSISMIFNADPILFESLNTNFRNLISCILKFLLKVKRFFKNKLILPVNAKAQRNCHTANKQNLIQNCVVTTFLRGMGFKISLIICVLFLLKEIHAQESPFIYPTRYPSVPGTLMGVVQIDAQPVRPGAVLGFYQGVELRGRFEVTSSQIANGLSYFNAVIQQSGQSESLTKAVLWIPHSEMLYELSMGLSMPLSSALGDFESIQTYSFTQVLFDESLIQTLSKSRVLGALQTFQNQDLIISAPQIFNEGDILLVTPNAIFTQHGSTMEWNSTTRQFKYKPRPDFTGEELIFLPLPGSQDIPLTYLKVQVNAVNDAPVVLSRTYRLKENEPIRFVLEASDVENNPLSYTILTLPMNGTVSGTPPNLIYRPDDGFSGLDSLHVRVSNGNSNSEVAVISFDVEAANGIPTAFSQSVVINEDSYGPIRLAGTDLDNDPLSYRITQGPTHGILLGDFPTIVYQPKPDFSGFDSFKFVVSDGSVDSAEASVSIEVKALNDAPLINEGLFTLKQGESLDFVLTGSDPDQDPLTFEIVTHPKQGTLSGTLPSLTYLPTTGFHGTDSFQARASDGRLLSETVTIGLVVQPVNHAPVAESVDVQVWFHDQVVLPSLGTDPDGDALSVEMLTDPSFGILTEVDGNLLYQHTGPTLETDKFSYRVSDGFLTSSAVTVTLSVAKASFKIQSSSAAIKENDEPISLTIIRTTHIDRDLSFRLTASTPSRLVFPANITIPAGQTDQNILLSAIDNVFFEGDINAELKFASNELNDQQIMFTVVDDDFPSLLLKPFFHQFSENQGETPVTLFFNRPPSDGWLSFELLSSDPTRLKVPSQVALEPGESQATFIVEAIDNSITEGDRDVKISVSFAPAIQAQTTLTLLDDDVTNVGRLSDGWIVAATVFFDRNRNRHLDAGEPATITDETGRFWLDLPVSVYDANGDNQIDASDGLLVGTGGVDMTTGLHQTSVLLSSPAATVISPLTTLLVLVVEKNSSLTETEAAMQVQSALKMDAGSDIMNVDPFEAIGNGDASPISVIRAAAKVQDTTIQIGKLLSSASGFSLDDQVDAARELLADRIGMGETLELNNEQWVGQLIDDIARASGFNLTSEIVSVASAIVSQGNQQKDKIASSGLSADVVAQEIVRTQAFNQSRALDDLGALAKRQIDPETLRLQYSSYNYTNLVQGTGIGKLTQLDTRPGTFQFGKTNFEVKEDGQHDENLNIKRSHGSLGTVRLRIDLEADSAEDKEDFVATPIELIFQSFEINQYIPLADFLIDDTLIEGKESFKLHLSVLESELDGAIIGEMGEATVDVLDNDGEGVIQFTQSTISVSEAVSNISGAFIERQSGSSESITVLLEYVEVGSDAELGRDFEWISQEVIFPSGVTKRAIPLHILDDTLLEQDETLFIRLRLHPEKSQGAVLGSKRILEISLLNDDVGDPPIIEAPDVITIREDASLGPVTVTVMDSDTIDKSISVWCESDNQLIQKNEIHLQKLPTPGSYSLTATPIRNGNGNVTLTLYASDGYQIGASKIHINIEPENDFPEIIGLPDRLKVGLEGRMIEFKVQDIETSSDELMVLMSAWNESRSMEDLFHLEKNDGDIKLQILPTEEVIGEITLQFMVIDGEGLVAKQTCQISFSDNISVPQIYFKRMSNTKLRLTWAGDLQLYATKDIHKHFEPVTGAKSPFDIIMDQNQFYILRSRANRP